MDKELKQVTILVIAGGIALIIGVWSVSASKKVYNVWAEKKRGEAELAHAEYNRQIKIYEAKAAEEAARHLCNAEIIRAEGVAKANQIIGNSLKDNEGYLRYLWITGLDHSNHQVIYVPTEANIPIMEAGKR